MFEKVRFDVHILQTVTKLIYRYQDKIISFKNLVQYMLWQLEKTTDIFINSKHINSNAQKHSEKIGNIVKE